MVADTLLPSLVIVNSASIGQLAYSSVMKYWFHSCLDHLVYLSFNELPPSVLLNFCSLIKYECLKHFLLLLYERKFF